MASAPAPWGHNSVEVGGVTVTYAVPCTRACYDHIPYLLYGSTRLLARGSTDARLHAQPRSEAYMRPLQHDSACDRRSKEWQTEQMVHGMAWTAMDKNSPFFLNEGRGRRTRRQLSSQTKLTYTASKRTMHSPHKPPDGLYYKRNMPTYGTIHTYFLHKNTHQVHQLQLVNTVPSTPRRNHEGHR